jgi:hypothetical protein
MRFGVSRGLLLGFLVSARGIEENPEKITAIMHMGPLNNIKDAQKLMGCLASLGRFISRLGERGLPLYKCWGTQENPSSSKRYA